MKDEKGRTNVAVVSSYESRGGAARAALRLTKGLNAQGFRARMLVREKSEGGTAQAFPLPSMFQAEIHLAARIQREEIQTNRSLLSNSPFSLGYPGVDISQHEVVAGADIINLHWVTRFLSVESVSTLLRKGKPLVWTLHDERAFSGGCHYSAGCREYERECAPCAQLERQESDLPRLELKNKIRSWTEDLTVVTPSKWLAEKARKSRVFRDCRIEAIPNSLETQTYVPLEKKACKEHFSLDAEQVALLLGAENHGEKRKGFDLAMEVLARMERDTSTRPLIKEKKLVLLVFGKPHKDIDRLAIPYKALGYINNEEELIKAYSAADLYVLPSREDNFPNTMLEAMSCGTPVVAFAAGGMPEAVVPKVNGDLAEAFDASDMAGKLARLIVDQGRRRELSANCRRIAEEKFRLSCQAASYGDLFADLLAKGLPGRRKEKEAAGKVFTRPFAVADYLVPHLNRSIKKTCDELEEKKLQLANQRKRILKMQGEMAAIRQSPAYRIGKCVVAPARLIAGLVRALKRYKTR